MPNTEDELLAQVRARIQHTIYDLAAGLTPTPKLPSIAPARTLSYAEASLGFFLPPLLRRLYAEVASGGFGPGYGIIGVREGYGDFSNGTIEPLYAAFRAGKHGVAPRSWPERMLPLCNWGCGIYSAIDCSQPLAPVFTYRGAEHVLAGQQITATLTSATGEVLWTYNGKSEHVPLPGLTNTPAPSTPSERSANDPLLTPHRPSLVDWLSAWAAGTSLWDEIEKN